MTKFLWVQRFPAPSRIQCKKNFAVLPGMRARDGEERGVLLEPPWISISWPLRKGVVLLSMIDSSVTSPSLLQSHECSPSFAHQDGGQAPHRDQETWRSTARV